MTFTSDERREVARKLRNGGVARNSVVSTISYDWPEGSEYRHELSCGHTCDTDWPEPPEFCSECGARVVEKEEDE